MNWKGVTPAITTPFNENLSIDHGFLAKHCRWLLDSGCTGVVALGSLGEGATGSLTAPGPWRIPATGPDRGFPSLGYAGE